MIDNLSVFSVLRTAVSSDLLFSLVNSSSQRDYPILGLTILSAVFVAITPFFFPEVGNPLAVGVITTFFAFWASVVFSFFVLLLFGMKAPSRYMQKATFVALATFLFATMLFDSNLLQGLDPVNYVGDDFKPVFWVAVMYCLPYPVFCMIKSEGHLRDRFNLANAKARSDTHRNRLDRLKQRLRGRSIAALVAIVLFSAFMMNLTILQEDKAPMNKVVTEITGALSFAPA